MESVPNASSAEEREEKRHSRLENETQTPTGHAGGGGRREGGRERGRGGEVGHLKQERIELSTEF